MIYIIKIILNVLPNSFYFLVKICNIVEEVTDKIDQNKTKKINTFRCFHEKLT